ncbi:hypothetical protein ABEY55_08360 [Priestia aryabhattai]|uniref:hypothetical protein n=1 Tax=Priestia aryabhattai TaxID=412384 RepID=UPI003D2C7B6B
MVYLMDLERSIASGKIHYWKANKQGYMTNIQQAGLYSPEIAEQIVNSDYDKRTVMIDEAVVKKIRSDFCTTLLKKSIEDNYEALKKMGDE